MTEKNAQIILQEKKLGSTQTEAGRSLHKNAFILNSSINVFILLSMSLFVKNIVSLQQIVPKM